ncbi:MAG: response regulator receiver protein [Psychromonas sp.]|nr:response regulator receiver protein [Psychromonas sp.]
MRYLLIFLLAIFSTHVLAQPTWHTSKVANVYPLSDGRVVVRFQSDHTGCTNGNTPKYYYLGVGHNGVTELGLKNMYSALLTAGASKKDVTINFDSATEYCEINRLSVSFQ